MASKNPPLGEPPGLQQVYKGLELPQNSRAQGSLYEEHFLRDGMDFAWRDFRGIAASRDPDGGARRCADTRCSSTLRSTSATSGNCACVPGATAQPGGPPSHQAVDG